MRGYPQFCFNIRIEYELKMLFHTRLRPTVVFDVIILSSKVKKDDFYLFSKKIWHFFNFICAYLGISWPIFSQIEVCYSWNNTLSVFAFIFHFDDVIMVKNSIKGDKSKFREFTCYVYGSFFSSNYELTWPCSLCRILFFARAISLKFWYVVAET